VKFQTYGVATPGQIERAPLIATVLPSAQLAALGARNGLARGFGNQHQTSITLDRDQDNAPVLTLPPSDTTIGSYLDPDAIAISRRPEEGLTRWASQQADTLEGDHR
jgi:hypothetical protein